MDLIGRDQIHPGAVQRVHLARGAVTAAKLSGDLLVDRVHTAARWHYQSDNIRYQIAVGGPSVLTGTWAPWESWPVDGYRREYRMHGMFLYVPGSGTTAASSYVRLHQDQNVSTGVWGPTNPAALEVREIVGPWVSSPTMDAYSPPLGGLFLNGASDWATATGQHYIYWLLCEARYIRE